MRTIVRSTLIAGLTGGMIVSAAWAGVGLAPVPTATASSALVGTTAARVAGEPAPTGTAAGTTTAALAGGQVLVGAAKTSMNPRPEDMKKRFPGARWETDPAKCKTLQPAWLKDIPNSAINALDGIANPGSVWPENPDCIYMGGFGIGPQNPVQAFDQEGVIDLSRNRPGLGLWVRSIAISDGRKPFVMTVVDAEGWLWDYKSKCTDCGAKQISAALASDPELAGLGLAPSSFILHATHSHSGPDFIGGWGFVPNWYMAQITDTIKATAKRALLTMAPATLETGEIEARAFNSERRGTYRSAEEQQLSWLRAVAVPAAAAPVPVPAGDIDTDTESNTGPGNDASPAPAPAPTVIATLGAYAAHPTTRGTNGMVASSDWVGGFEKRVEDRFGGIGLHFMTGLGNMSASGGSAIGANLANLVPAVGAGIQVADTAVRVAQVTYRSPLTNVPLTALGTPGLFDRKFDVLPAAVAVGKSTNSPCVSTSPQSVELPVTVAKIGAQIVFTTGPGEEFSNLTNTIKDKNAGKVTFPLAQVNDALGYMPQSFELNPVGQQALGFVAGGYLFVNYEDSYAIDRCVGDGLLEATLKAVNDLK